MQITDGDKVILANSKVCLNYFQCVYYHFFKNTNYWFIVKV